MQYTYQDIFFHCSKQFLNSTILMPFSSSVVVVSPLLTYFIKETKKVAGTRSGEYGRWGMGVLLVLVQNC